jgi:hypothetical protein
MQITGSMSRGPVVVVMAIVALGVSGCGSSDSDAETPASPSTSSTGPAPSSSAGPISSGDPATLDGGCDILLGDEGILDAALAAGEGDDDAERQRVQDRLFAIVSAKNDSLGDAAGQLVDYLDDPSAYVKDGELDASVTTAEADIRETCDVL